MFFALLRKNPVLWMIRSILAIGAAARSAAVGYFLNSSGVTILTRTSVHWAERMVAISNSNGLANCSGAAGIGVSLPEPLGHLRGKALSGSGGHARSRGGELEN